MATLSREQTAQVAYQAGFRGEALVRMVAIAGRESGYRSDAHRSDIEGNTGSSGDRGLWQINYLWDGSLRSAGIINSWSDLFDPVKNAEAAKYVFDNQGWAAWGVSGGSWGAGPSVTNTDMDAARAAVNNASNQGLLGQAYSGAGGGGGGGGGGAANSSSGDKSKSKIPLPNADRIIQTNMGLWAVFKWRGTEVVYSIDWTDPSFVYDKDKVQKMNHNTFHNNVYKGAVKGGSAKKLAGIKEQYGTYSNMMNEIVWQFYPPGHPALNDASVIRQILEFSSRPDMGESELENRLKTTDYWKNKTAAEVAFNNLSPADKKKARQDAQAQVSQIVWGIAGERMGDGHPLSKYINDVAAGVITISAFERIARQYASKNSESPWMREVRSEKESQRQRGIDIENTARNIRETLLEWGLSWKQKKVNNWAKWIVEKKRSDDDLVKQVKAAAAGRYPKKPYHLDTATWAEPWLQTFETTLERPGDILLPKMQEALTKGESVADFQRQLKRSEEWLETSNARESVFSTVAQAGELLGFN